MNAPHDGPAHRRIRPRSTLGSLARILVLLSLLIAPLALQAAPVQADEADYAWRAYNDCAGTTGGNTTAYTIEDSASGLLKDYDTGDDTPVTVTFASSGSPTVQTMSGYSGDETDPGTDAYETFHGYADMAGVIQYGSDGWWVDVTFSGLDPDKTYTFATSANRDDEGYTDRVARFTISGMDGATNASTSGVTVHSNESVAFSTGYNTTNGYVARWTGIQPGADGQFKVRAESDNEDERRAYAFSVLQILEEIDPGPRITTLGALSSLSTTPGTASDPQTYQVSGSALTAAITITAPDGFELSTDGAAYSSTLTLSPTDGEVAPTTIHVRLNAPEGSYSGDITHTSGDATPQTVAVSGVVGWCYDLGRHAVADTRVRASQATTNYGDEDSILISPREASPQNGLFQWDLSDIPEDAEIQDASITFHVIQASDYIFHLYELLQAWEEDTATWDTYDGSNDWATGGAEGATDRGDTNLWVVDPSPFGATGFQTIALNAAGVDLVQGWVDGSADNLGFTVSRHTVQESGSTTDYWEVASREATDESQRPTLNVHYCIVPPTYTLTVGVEPTGGGTTSPAAGPHEYTAGEQVQITAQPAAGYTFTGWGGACSGTGACTVTMDAAKSVTAQFTLNTYSLTVAKTGTGSGMVTSEPAGIACGDQCSATFDHGTEVTLTAAPADGSAFAGWSGACSGTGTCVVTMDEAKSVTAQFTLNAYSLTVVKTGTGSGTVTSAPAGIACGTDCGGTFSHGIEVTLTAEPAAGSTFAGWGGACSGTGPCTVTMDGAQAVTAEFTVSSYSLSVSREGTGSGTVTSDPAGIACGADCTEVFSHGTEVTLTAAPADGSTFAGWGGACSGTGTCVVTMDGAKAVVATFDLQTVLSTPDLTLQKTADRQTVAEGGAIAYTLHYANAGADAAGVGLTETVPDHALFDAMASTAGWACTNAGAAGGHCTLPIGDLAEGQEGTVTFAVTVADSLPDGIAAIVNTASIADDGTAGADADPTDNEASIETAIETEPVPTHQLFIPLVRR